MIATASRNLVVLSQMAVVLSTVMDLFWPSHVGVSLIALSGVLYAALAKETGAVALRRTVWLLTLATLALLPGIEAPWAVLEKGIRIGGLISSILLSVSLLSRAAQRVAVLREVVRRLLDVPARQRAISIPIASQLFGGFLGFAGIAMLMEAAAEMKHQTKKERQLCFQGISRGYAAANLWSPMYSNISILLALSPGLTWAKIFPYALMLAAASLVLSWAMSGLLRSGAGASEKGKLDWRAVAAMAWPVVLGMMLFLLLAVSFSLLLHVPIAAFIIGMSPLAALVLTMYLEPKRRSFHEAWRQLSSDFRGFESLAGEVRLLMVSGCAGTVVAAAIPASWTLPIAQAVGVHPILASFFLAAAVVLISCTSVHPILSAIVVASTFPAVVVGLEPMFHVLSVLAGLGLAVVTTPFSVVSLTASRFSGLPLLTVSMKANFSFAAISLLLVCTFIGCSASRLIH